MMTELFIFLSITSLSIILIDVFLYFKEKEAPRRSCYSGSDLVDAMAIFGSITLLMILTPISFFILFSSSISLTMIGIVWVIQSSIGTFIAIFYRKQILDKCNKCFNKNSMSHSLWYLFLVLIIILFTVPFIISKIIEFVVNITIFNNIFYSFYKESLKDNNQ